MDPASDDLTAYPDIEWLERPDLASPILIAAFAGWNDAGDAATNAAGFLADRWEAQTFASLDPEEFYDFNTTRPMVSIDDDGERQLSWPSTDFSYARVPGAEADIVLVRGIEPNLRWRSFCENILHVAATLGVERVITLGALLAEVPHSRPVPIFGSSNDTDLQARHDLQPSSYEGPTGIVGVLTTLGAEAGFPSMGLWAAVPAYVAGAPSPKATEALVTKAAEVLGTAVSTTDLQAATAEYENQVGQHVADDPETLELIRRLESERDDYDAALASGGELADEVERFLRDNPEN